MVKFWELLTEPSSAIWAITGIVIAWVLCIVFDCFDEGEARPEDQDYD